MNTCESRTEWHILMGNLKQEWAELTYDDLQDIEGNLNVLLERIQQRTGYPRETIESAIIKYRAALADANRHQQLRDLSKFRS